MGRKIQVPGTCSVTYLSRPTLLCPSSCVCTTVLKVKGLRAGTEQIYILNFRTISPCTACFPMVERTPQSDRYILPRINFATEAHSYSRYVPLFTSAFYLRMTPLGVRLAIYKWHEKSSGGGQTFHFTRLLMFDEP